jgi:pseudouridine-5'-phosphate glycosidase
MGFVLIFDIPEREAVEKVRINRELHRAEAKMIQNSVWGHENLNQLIDFAVRIRNLGGKASILEEKFIF